MFNQKLLKQSVAFLCMAFMFFASSVYTFAASDTTPPTAPSNLTATAVRSTEVDLSWSAATDNVGVTVYKVYLGSGYWGETTGTSFTAKGLIAGRSYDFAVRAFDAAGNGSVASNRVYITTPGADKTPPNAPTNLKATAVRSTEVDLSWTAATDNVGVTVYKVYLGSSYWGETAGTSFTAKGLISGRSYDFAVRAYDAAGNGSVASNRVYITTP